MCVRMFEQFVDRTHEVGDLRVFGGQGGLEVAGGFVLGAAVVYYVVRYRFFRLRRLLGLLVLSVRAVFLVFCPSRLLFQHVLPMSGMDGVLALVALVRPPARQHLLLAKY